MQEIMNKIISNPNENTCNTAALSNIYFLFE